MRHDLTHAEGTRQRSVHPVDGESDAEPAEGDAIAPREDGGARDQRYFGRGMGAGLLDATRAWARQSGFQAVVAKATPPTWPIPQFMGGMPLRVYASRGFEEKAHFFGRNLHDHIAAGVHNLADGEPPLLERSVYYDGLSEASVRELRELAERAGMEALQAVNRRAQELQRRDAEADEQNLRMTFGAYFFRARTDDPTEEETDEGDDEA